ncbi:transcriptional regulator with XRE-family HTH domain [Azospirillum sp. OGB3]|nr:MULTISPECIES: helix-turn-helix domain-containing protein [Azospirillum]MBB3268298.1 transcriptional regulator with XRE-family HTH domain [Azospirillum sp. OGB3]
MEKLEGAWEPVHTPIMLTGNQIRAARQLAGMRRQDQLGKAAKLGVATIQRAEKAGDEIPSIAANNMADIVRALEVAGIVFELSGGSLAGGVTFRKR